MFFSLFLFTHESDFEFVWCCFLCHMILWMKGKRKWEKKGVVFFCVRDRKYPTGLRTNRATDAGYWKTIGNDKEIFRGKSLVGMRTTLVFYEGRAPKGDKTNWVMQEYRLEGKFSLHNLHKKERYSFFTQNSPVFLCFSLFLAMPDLY